MFWFNYNNNFDTSNSNSSLFLYLEQQISFGGGIARCFVPKKGTIFIQPAISRLPFGFYHTLCNKNRIINRTEKFLSIYLKLRTAQFCYIT